MGSSDRRKFFDSLWKMDPTTWLSLVIAVVTLATPALSSEPRVVCYYTNWSVYRPGTARFNPQNINPYLCTHLVYAFGGFTKDNTFKPFDKYQDIEKGGYAKFTGLKTYNKNLKTMLAIGGWNEGSSRFSPMVASRDKRKEFVRNAIKFLRQNRFDGLDLDWEYPAFRDGGKPKDRENYAKLVRELREEFDREAEKTGKPRLLLTMAVPAGIEYIQKGFDVKTLNKYLDWMNLLTYDYHSAFEPAVNHHAPLYPLEEPNEYSVDNELNIDYTIKFYLENGADPDKLVLGIPTYGRSYTLFNKDAVEIGSPADGPGEQGDATREKGYLAYYEICESLKPKKKKRAASDEDSDEDSSEDVEDEPWTVVQPNANAVGPFAYRGNQWVGYDDVDIVRKKAEYVAENGLGGIMFWSIDNDDFRGTCHGKPYPLIEAAKEAYIVKLGSTDNAIVTDRPRTATTVRSTGNRRRNRPRGSSTTERTTTTKSSSKRKSASSITSTTPTWNIVTPEPPTTPDPGSDFKCTDEGFFPHPRDCKKYFWCLDSGPSNLGIVAHQFTCPSGLFFNKAADSCDFARNVLCKKPTATTKAPTTKPVTTTTTSTTRKPVKLSTKSSALFRTTTTTTTTTTPEPEEEEEYGDEADDAADIDAEDPKVIKELIDLIRKVGGVEQLERQLHLSESSSTDGAITTTPASIAINKRLYQKVLERTRGNRLNGNSVSENGGSSLSSLYSRRGPQNVGLESTADKDKLLKKDRPQYTTINRSRSSTSTQQPEEDDLEDIPVSAPRQAQSRRVEESREGTTAKPLQYVNIRRARPLATSDTADDTASRNALFERSESYATVSETPNSLDIASARRENAPEYVTIRRQRPTTEEVTTEQYQNTEPEEPQETALEREISSPQISSQPQYTSIVRTRSTTTTTTPAAVEITPEPTTVLAVQISSLLNSPSSEVETSVEDTKTTIPEATETIPITTTTTSTTTQAPASASTRRTILRRRGSTTTTTTQATPSSSTQVTKRSFLRRTKATAAPDSNNPDVATASNKFKRTSFKSRTSTEAPELATKSPEGAANEGSAGKDANGGKRARRPSLNSSGARNERPTRNFVRRRLGGANATTTSTTPPSSSSATSTASAASVATRRPFRVASRRRPLSTPTTTTTTTTTTEVPTTALLTSEEYLQDIGDTDFIEDPTSQERPTLNLTKTRRPLLLKDEPDQNPSATNEEERKRHSKKYSASFKQNQLDEVLKKREKNRSTESQEVDVTTTEALPQTTADDNDAETALAIAAHQLLSAPLPSIPNYDDEPKPTKKSSKPTTIHEYEYTSPTYTDEYSTKDTNTYDYTSTPIYKIGKDYLQTTAGNVYDFTTNFNSARTASTSPKYQSTTFTSRVSRPAAFTTANILSTLSQDPTKEFSRIPQNPTANPGFSRNTESRGFTKASTSSLSSGFTTLPSNLGPSTSRYVGSTDKLIPVPVEDYSFTTGGYSSISQEPSYFTREYLLESPVTKTYDDEYQYLSPTTPQATTRKIPKKITYRKISTTIRPTIQSYVPEVTSSTPRRVPNRKPFEKIPLDKEIKPKYKAIDNYDYYDDGAEHLASKYGEGTKVVLHSKGTIECLDIGNFPHPSSCKQFISCARLENGSLLGWEYICPKGLSFDPVGGICNWSAGLGCNEKDV